MPGDVRLTADPEAGVALETESATPLGAVYGVTVALPEGFV